MNRPSLIYIESHPWGLNDRELEDFHEMVLRSQEIDPSGLMDRIQDASKIVRVFSGDELVGVAALKNRPVAYRRSLFDRAGIPLRPVAYPHELGWVFVKEAHRRRRIAYNMTTYLLEEVVGGVYAVCRSGNSPMKSILNRCGLQLMREGINSNSGCHTLDLFISK